MDGRGLRWRSTLHLRGDTSCEQNGFLKVWGGPGHFFTGVLGQFVLTRKVT
jgi:hypothetical protein